MPDALPEPTPSLHPVLVEVSIAPTLNFAMEQSGVPFVSGLRVQNLGAERLAGATFTVAMEPELGEPSTLALETIRGGEELYLPAVDVRLPPGRLRALVEAERGRVSWSLRCGDLALASGAAAIELLAFNEWPGLRAPPALIAAFVMPNHPVIATLLRRCRDRLLSATGDASISGYQTRSPKRVVEQVEALIGAIHDLGLSYVGLPASFETSGQKVRLPDVVIHDGMGNCLDITVLVAACLEQMGLAPLVVIVSGHAFPAVWLVDERFPEGVVHDAARLRTLVKLDQLLVFDSSTLVHSARPPLSAAVATATARLDVDADFLCAVDVRVVRLDRFRPLPIRMTVRSGDIHDTATVAATTVLNEAFAEADPEPAAGGAAAPTDSVVARFKRWRDRLLDLSLNNRLLNYRPGAKASLPLQVPDLAEFEDLLSGDKVFEVLPRPDVDPRDQRDETLTKARVDEADLVAQRRADLKRGILHAPATRDDLLGRAVELDRAARMDREEGGANTLFAAIGMLKWFESASSELPRLAPLLLVPVRLEYDRVTRRIRLRRLDEEAVGNVTLVEKMRRDFAVDLSGLANLEADDSGVDVPALLRRARIAIQQTPRWEVLDEVHLGLFTFTKFLMWKDLETNADALLQSEVVKHLAQGGRVPFVDRVGEPATRTLDDELRADAVPTVLDCDSTQLAAVSAALRGRNFVLQGPPGTGKSQTITNLIAAALAEGKTVLFVSEKMAALDVVYRRLRDAGLGDYCLELHSNKANKKGVAVSLGKAMERVTRAPDGAWESRSAEIDVLRGHLNGYARALHAPRKLGRTFYEASARLLALRSAHEVRVDVPEGGGLAEAQWRTMELAVDAFAVAAAEVEPVPAHAWRMSGASEWGAAAEAGAKEAVSVAIEALDLAAERANALLLALGAPAPWHPSHVVLGRTIGAGPVPASALSDTWPAAAARVREWARVAEEDAAQRAELATRWQPSLFEMDLPRLATTFRSWADAFFLFAFLFLLFPRQALLRVARGPVPANRRVAADLALATALERVREERAREKAWVVATFAGVWEEGDLRALSAVLERIDRLRAAVALCRADGIVLSEAARALLDPALPQARREAVGAAASRSDEAAETERAAIDVVERALVLQLRGDVRSELVRLAGSFRSFRSWCFYRRAAKAVEAVGLAPVVRAHEGGSLRAASAPDAAERAVLTAWVASVRDSESALRGFDGAEQERRVVRFRELDRAHIQLGRQRVLARLDSRRPALSAGLAETSEPGVLAREVKKQRAHMPVRKLLQAIPNLLPRLKPCLLMSPLSIAQYLAADGRRFDLVVFDEASQIGTHDAIGAIARGNQVVIVGDSRQLPPTSFFTRDSEDETLPDDNDVVEMESILDEALAARLPEQMLGWHYRSRHEALIAFSNRHYYDDRLNVFPAARGQVTDLGVRWHGVPKGVYDKGRTRQNRLEAEALTAWLVAELRRTSPKARTFGVVTFSLPQQTLIQDLLDRARGQYPEIEAHFADTTLEPVFVKNLENVQGDERDVILFSICYGPDETGKTWMNFGPLNRRGGERRLNVAVTRARCALHVFSTMTADHIDLARTTALGARHLKAFLTYATEHGSATQRAKRTAPFDSEFERQVHDALVGLGYSVDGQVGCGGYRIDLAIVHPEHPGEYVLGIECDGAPYHSGATARDRDRLRQDVLQGLGWRLHRVWSTDWWFDRDRQMARLEEAVRAALAAPREEPPVVELPEPEETAPIEMAVARAAESPPLVPYPTASLAEVSVDPESLYAVTATAALRERIRELVRVEAPVHVDEVCRRVAACWGVGRLTGRVRTRVTGEVSVLATAGAFIVRGDFVWPRELDPASWAVIRGPGTDGAVRDADLLPPEEVATGAAWVLSRSLSLDEATLARETAKLFGITRLGRHVDQRMRAGIDVLVVRGTAAREGERLSWRA